MARDGLEHRKVVIVDGETAFFGGVVSAILTSLR